MLSGPSGSAGDGQLIPGGAVGAPRPLPAAPACAGAGCPPCCACPACCAESAATPNAITLTPATMAMLFISGLPAEVIHLPDVRRENATAYRRSQVESGRRVVLRYKQPCDSSCSR